MVYNYGPERNKKFPPNITICLAPYVTIAIFQTHVWETLAHEVESDQLLNKVLDADNQDDKEAVESYLCGKLLKFKK